MTPTSDTPDNRPVPDPEPPPSGRATPADAPESADPPGEDVGVPAANEAVVPESDLVDMPDDGLTAEERLLDSIVSDPRAAASMDESDTGTVFTPDAAELPPTQAEDERSAQAMVPESEPDVNGVLSPSDTAPVSDDSLAIIRRLEDDLGCVSRELAQVTVDRDDLSNRLDLAAVEFERMTQEIDRQEQECGRLRTALAAAEGALKVAQDGLADTQGRVVQALKDRDAARGRIEEVTAVSQREQDQLRLSLRQLQKAEEEEARRRWQFVRAGAIVMALLAGAGGYMAGRSSPPLSAGKAGPLVVAPALPAPAVAAPVREAPTNVVRLAGPAVAPPAWPSIRDPRLITHSEPDALVIRFKEPVFARAVEMHPAGRQDLRRLAALLKPYTTACRVEVEGHTDPSPVTRRGSYAGNHELGLMRARMAVDVLAGDGGLPLSSLSVSSAGDARPPFPGDSADARRRCRTVVVKLHRVRPGAP